MQGTSVQICWSDWVIFSIWGSVKIGSGPFPKSSVSILYGMNPFGQRAAPSATNAAWTSPPTRWLSGTTMSPSTRWLESGVSGGGANSPRWEGLNATQLAKSPKRLKLSILAQVRIATTCGLHHMCGVWIVDCWDWPETRLSGSAIDGNWHPNWQVLQMISVTVSP